MEDGMTARKGPEPPDIASLRRMFEEASELTKDSRAASQVDDDYFHNHQLTREEKAALRARRQPDGTFNRIRPAIPSSSRWPRRRRIWSGCSRPRWDETSALPSGWRSGAFWPSDRGARPTHCGHRPLPGSHGRYSQRQRVQPRV